MPARAAQSTDEGVDVEKIVQDLQARVRGRICTACVQASNVHILHHLCSFCANSILLLDPASLLSKTGSACSPHLGAVIN